MLEKQTTKMRLDLFMPNKIEFIQKLDFYYFTLLLMPISFTKKIIKLLQLKFIKRPTT